MRKKIGILICVFVLTGCSFQTKSKVEYQEYPDTKILVATDLHYLSETLTDNGPFFMDLIENSDGKTMAYSEELMNAFVSQVIEEKADTLIVSGDITFNGEKESHEKLAEKFDLIQESGTDVVVIPGNHDMYNQFSVKYEGEAYRTTASIGPSEYKQIYSTFGYNEALSRDAQSLSYVFPIHRNLRVLLLDVNTQSHPNDVSEQTLLWIEDQLKRAEKDGARVIAVSHQNVLEHNDTITKGFVIESSKKITKLYEKYNVIANFSGHIHMQHIAMSPKEKFPEIVTSSLTVTPNQYGVIELNNESLDYRTQAVDVSSWANQQGYTDPNLLDFSQYSEMFFWDSSYKKGNEALGYDDEQLAKFFADVNLEYFRGTNGFDPEDALFDAWIKASKRFGPYMKSIQYESQKDHNAMTIELKK